MTSLFFAWIPAVRIRLASDRLSVFWAIIVVASALIVAKTRKELALLAGKFLVGLGVLEMALQIAGH